MKILKDGIRILLVALIAIMLPLNGYCCDDLYELQLRNPEDYYPFMCMALALVFILLVFAVIFYAIKHKTSREKMHIELLIEMVRQGVIPTSEQVVNKSVVDEIAVNEKGQIKLKKKIRISFPKILLIAVGVLWLFGAMNTSGDISAMLGVAGSLVVIYAVMDIRNVAFWQRNISTLNIMNLVVGLGALFIGLWKSRDFAEALFPFLLPGGYLVYYAVSMLSAYNELPRFEFKIKRVEQYRQNEKRHEFSVEKSEKLTEEKDSETK